MAVKQLANVLVLLTSVFFAVCFSGVVIERDLGTAYTEEEQKALLESHNNYRSKVSPAASNMVEMTWDADLAIQAQVWADFCVFEHPDKDVHLDYSGIGQNLYTSFNWYGYETPKPSVTAAIKSWYDEVEDYDYDSNTCDTGKVCGHYTQVVWADTTAVGCGINYCPSAKYYDGSIPDAWIVVCNYKPGGNYWGVWPYEEGDACTKCSDGKPCKDGLCSDCKPNGQDCECKIKCENCGTSVSGDDTCGCECPNGYYGPYCEEYCEDKHRYCGANPGWPTSWCNTRSYVNDYCPVLCNLCTQGDEVDPNNC